MAWRRQGMADDAPLDWQRSVLDLNYGEHLLVWTIRSVVVRREMCAAIVREFEEACGEDAGEVLATFRVFLNTLGQAARRSISVGHPEWFGLTGDERQILSMIRAAQHDDPTRLDALICWFARAEFQPDLAIAAQALATAFAIHGLEMSAARRAAVIVPAARPHLRVVS